MSEWKQTFYTKLNINWNIFTATLKSRGYNLAVGDAARKGLGEGVN